MATTTVHPTSTQSLALPVRAFFATDGWAPTVLRVALGVVILPHGLQKTVGLFGGYGFSGTMGFLTEQMGLPSPIAFSVILFESLGALLLIAGVGGRLWAAGIAAVMVGAVATMHWGNGFFMNWFGNQAGEGWEYHLLAVGMAAAVIVAGSGKVSVDRWLASAFSAAASQPRER